MVRRSEAAPRSVDTVRSLTSVLPVHPALFERLRTTFVFATLALFLGVPLLVLVGMAFLSQGTYGQVVPILGFAQFARLLDPVYLQVIGRSLYLAVQTTIICLAVAAALAWWIRGLSGRARWIAMGLFGVPLLIQSLVRLLALSKFLSSSGIFNAWLGHWLTESVGLTIEVPSSEAMTLGMITLYLPFAFFPILTGFSRLDRTLVESARDLGASPFTVFRRIVMPLTSRSWFAAASLVAVPALGEVLIPDLLGGGRHALIGSTIGDQFIRARNWPFGAVLALFLIAAALALHRGVLERHGDNPENLHREERGGHPL